MQYPVSQKIEVPDKKVYEPNMVTLAGIVCIRSNQFQRMKIRIYTALATHFVGMTKIDKKSDLVQIKVHARLSG